MDCNNAKELLSFYVYDEIENRDRQRLDAHLQVCGGCTRELENFRVVREAMSELPDPEVPVDFLVGVRARIDQPVSWLEQVDDVVSALTGRRAMAGASMALAAGFAFLVGNTSGDLSAPPARLQSARQESDALLSSVGSAPVRSAKEKRDVATDAADKGAKREVLETETASPASLAAGLADEAGASAPALASGALRAAAPMDRAVEPAAVTEARARRSAAESFDDVFGDSEEESLAPAAPAPPPPAAEPAPEPAPEPARVAAPSRATGGAPSSPFLERKNSPTKAKIKRASRDLDAMGANELGRELARLDRSPSRRARRPREADLSIFSPQEDAELLGGEDYAADGFADDMGGLSAGESFGGGSALARVSDGDPFDSGTGSGPGRAELFEEAPRVAPVTIAFLRTTFGRSVHVLQPTQVSRFPAQVGRDLGLRSQDPRSALQGIHSLLEAGLGLELQGVEMREDEEVTLLVTFASGSPGQRALDRFVEDLRGLAGTSLASDVASASGGEVGRLARISVPTR